MFNWFGQTNMKIQPMPTANSIDPKNVAVSNLNIPLNSSLSDKNLFSKSVSFINLKENEVTDLHFKGENLQQLSTNALPPYCPKSPPSYAKNDSSFEFHCCSDCGDTFALKSSLNFHLERRSILIKFPCETCKCVRIFYNRCTLQSHIRGHADKKEISNIGNAIVNPLPRVFMDGLQTEFVNTLDEELMDDLDLTPPTDILEFSLKEVEEETVVIEDKSICPSGTPKVKCIDCNEEFESAEARKEHLTNGDKIPFIVSQCNKCGMFCPSKCSLKAHQRIHLQVSPYVCPECGESPDFYWVNFQHHVKFKCFHLSRAIGYKCPVCKRVSPTNESLLKHMELHTEKYLKCELCPRAYMGIKLFDEHVAVHHTGIKAKYNTIYKCSLCDIVFLSSEQMLAHRSTHLKEQICEYVFNCMQCGKPLENKGLLLEHIRTCHQKTYKFIFKDETNESKPVQSLITYRGKVECILCNFTFHSPLGYNVHVARAHINVNQPCSYCYMIIGNRKEMVIHGKKHLNKGNIVCLLCNNKKFHDEKSLDSHLSKHTEKLQYCSFCPLCSEIMPTKQEAINHLRVEHLLIEKDSLETTGGKHEQQMESITCHFCRISFANGDEFQNHLQMVHSVNNQKRSLSISEETGQTGSDEVTKKQRVEGNMCAKCEYVSTEREDFKKHLLSHKTNKSTFQCQECGLCFIVEPSLVKHLRIIHKISDTKKYIEEEGTNFMPEFKKTTEVSSCDSLICSVCFTTFANEKSLKTHMRSHGMAFIQANKTIPAS